jgi:hypothetical protein
MLKVEKLKLTRFLVFKLKMTMKIIMKKKIITIEEEVEEEEEEGEVEEEELLKNQKKTKLRILKGSISVIILIIDINQY